MNQHVQRDISEQCPRQYFSPHFAAFLVLMEHLLEGKEFRVWTHNVRHDVTAFFFFMVR
jgi:hypothetical protein